LMRLRRAARPTLRPATRPNRGPWPAPAARQTPKCGVCNFFPWAWALKYSRRRRMRSSRVKRADRPGGAWSLGVFAWLRGSGVWFREAPSVSHREALAPFGPAASQHRAAASRAHAAQKTMGPGPAQPTRLIGTFHLHLSSSNLRNKLFINHFRHLLSRERPGFYLSLDLRTGIPENRRDDFRKNPEIML
jgi:hypothetical protein